MPAIRSVETRVLEDLLNPQLLVVVTADDGTRGVGECWWGVYRPSLAPGAPVRPIQSVVDELLAPLCAGWDADDPEGLFAAMEVETHPYGEGIVHAAMSGVDMAVWDALGRRRDLPIAELLGGAVHDAVPVYASFTWLGEEGAVRRDARRAVEAGFRAIKLHEHEPGLVAAARDEVGDDVAVMLDVSGRFDVTAAVAAARAYQAFDLEWLEEPVFPMRDHRALAAVRAQIEIPIAAGENEYTVEGFERLLTARAVDVVQPEIAKFGGCTPAMPVAALAAEHEVALCPHNFSLGPSFYASLQWALAAPQTRWLEMPLMPPGYVFPSGLTGPAATEGRMALPTLPGLGMPESFYRAVA